MGFFDRLRNDTSYNPLYLEDATGFNASFDEAVLDDDTKILIDRDQAKKFALLSEMYGEDYARFMIEQGLV